MISTAILSFTLLAATANPVDRAMADLRLLTVALEAYSTDYDGLYAQPGARREGTAADLDGVLSPIYVKNVPHLDPWGHPYRFLISDSGRGYAFYSLGPSGQLDPVVQAFLPRLKRDGVGEAELQNERTSQNIVFASGMMVFSLSEVRQSIQKARDEQPPRIFHTQPSGRDIEVLAVAIETYLKDHDALPQEARGKRVSASTLIPILTPLPGYAFVAVDPWKRPYEIAVSPSGRRAAVYTRGEANRIAAESETLIQQTLRGELTGTGTTYALDLVVTSLVPRSGQ